MDTDAITLHLDDELAKRLKVAAGQPVVIKHNGVRYRIEPEDPFAFYDPKKMRAALRASAGAWRGVVDAEVLKADIRAARGHGSETVASLSMESVTPANCAESEADSGQAALASRIG